MMAEANLCWICQHYRSGGECDAFPEGIPQAIFVAGEDHRTSRKGDNGVVFALDEKALEDGYFDEEYFDILGISLEELKATDRERS